MNRSATYNGHTMKTRILKATCAVTIGALLAGASTRVARAQFPYVPSLPFSHSNAAETVVTITVTAPSGGRIQASSADTPIAIPDNNPAGIESRINLTPTPDPGGPYVVDEGSTLLPSVVHYGEGGGPGSVVVGQAARRMATEFPRDTIVSVGAEPPPADAYIVDGGGGTLLPGLFDSHSHLADWAGALMYERKLYAASWLAAGAAALIAPDQPPKEANGA